MTVRTSRGTRKDDIVLVGRCGYYGAITKSSIQGPRGPPCSGRSAELCGDDGNMELEEMETSQQQHLILVIRYKRILSTAYT